MPSLHRVPVKFFHFVPAKSSEAKPSLRSPVHVRALVLLVFQELLELCHVGLGNLRLHPAVGQVREARVADHVARVARDHEAAGVPLVRGQGQLSGEALRLHQRLVVDHDQLALVRPAVPLQEDPRALVAQQPQLRAAVGGRAVVGHLQLAPAHPVLRQEEIVREVGGVGHGERVGGEELRRGDRARARHVEARARRASELVDGLRAAEGQLQRPVGQVVPPGALQELLAVRGGKVQSNPVPVKKAYLASLGYEYKGQRCPRPVNLMGTWSRFASSHS